MIDVTFYLKLLWRRLPVMLLLFLACTAAGVVVATRLPAIYRADARLLVESPRIPGELAASTVRTSANEEIEVIRQQLLTRANLLDIARDLNVFGAETDTMSADAIVGRMRGATGINSRARRGEPTFITVAFNARTGQVAADVVNEYVTRIIDANVEQRTGRAGDTLDFFEQEVDRLAAELDQASARITEFQALNSNALPGDQNFRLNRQSLLQERLSSLSRERTGLLEQRDRLTQLFESTGRVTGSSQDDRLTEDERRLATLRQQLDEALVTFSESNPRVVQIQARIDRLEATIAEATTPAEEDAALTANPQAMLFTLQREELDGRIAAMETEAARIEEELAELDAAIGQSGVNAITLQGLQRDYENISRQYNNAIQNLAQASMGERIELTARGQRINLIESATVPGSPASPNRPLIAGAGGAVGLGLAIGFFFLMELLNRTVRRPSEIVRGLGITPLATIPHIAGQAPPSSHRLLKAAAILVVLAGLPAALWAVDTYFFPLDMLAERLLRQLNLG